MILVTALYQDLCDVSIGKAGCIDSYSHNLYSTFIKGYRVLYSE